MLEVRHYMLLVPPTMVDGRGAFFYETSNKKGRFLSFEWVK